MLVALQFLLDLQHWVETDPRIMLRILRMMVEIQRDPLRGIGKPEPLKHDLGGFWSRRITDEDRLLYRLQGERIEFTDARWHYR
jgi:toxin YoeB